jgi:hypothetical protein
METGLPVTRYQFLASFADGVVEWTLCLETDDGKRHSIRLRDGEEVPILLELCRRDKSLYYDDKFGALRTGWNFPGGKHD